MGIMEKKMETNYIGLQIIVPLTYIEYGVYGDLIILDPKPYSIYLRGAITCSTKEPPDYCPPAPCQADQRMAQLFRYDMKGL